MRKLTYRETQKLCLSLQSLLVLLVCAIAFRGLLSIDQRIDQVTTQQRPVLDAVLNIQTHFVRIYPHYEGVLLGDLSQFKYLEEHLKDCHEILQDMQASLLPEDEAEVIAIQRSLKKVRFAISLYHQEAQYDQSGAYAEEIAELAQAEFQQASMSLDAIVDGFRIEMHNQSLAMAAEIARRRQTLLSLLFASIALGFLLQLLANRALATPMRHLIAGATKFGDGDLACRINLSSNDEFGRLAAAFKPLDRSLLATGVAVRQRDAEPRRNRGESAPPTREVTGTSRLMVIMSARGQRMALIESMGRTWTVRSGNRVGEETVIRIEADHVLLRGPDGTRELRFDDALQQ